MIQEVGCCQLTNVVELLLDHPLQEMENKMAHKELIQLVDRHVNPIGCELYILQSDKSYRNSDGTAKLQLKDTQLHEPSIMKLNPFTKGLTLRLRGCKFYLPVDNNLLVVRGYFRKTNTYAHTCYSLSRQKYRTIETVLPSLPEEAAFRNGFLRQLSLPDLLLYSPKELTDQCSHRYSELRRLRSKNISGLIKEFIAMEMMDQRDTLTTLLLDPSQNENLYIAFILFDLLSQETTQQGNHDHIYESLHWDQQRILHEARGKAETVTNELLQCTEETIPYEKRILLMQAPNRVKSKALEKLKEINGSKGGESTAKAQQYIEGLLKIPFGVYRNEEIISFVHDFRSTMNYIQDEISNLSLDLPGSYKTSGEISSSEIESYLNMLESELLKASNKCLSSLDTFVNPTLRSLLEDMNVSKSGSKPKLVQRILDHTSTLTLRLRLQYRLFSSEILKHTSFLESIIQALAEWKTYKTHRREYMDKVSQNLDNAVYGMEEAKIEVKRIFAQWINGSTDGYIIGFEGPPGTGKTTLAKQGIATCLLDANGKKRPFAFIALGGSTNGSTLDGHNYTYVGSTWGRIADSLMEAECMNPIIYIDELDKISRTEHGKELIGILIHLTDPSQNEEFMDKYFSGIKLDISKCLIIFSYNDVNQVDRVLLDRIHRIRIDAMNRHDKYRVAMDHLIPEISTTVGFRPGDVEIDRDTLFYIIDNYTYEAGARKLKERLFDLIREINLEFIMGNITTFPQKITKDDVKRVFHKQQRVQIKKIPPRPSVGLVNGLYATSAGTGGITIIESFRYLSDSRLSLELTGQQGDVMKESMRVSKTVAWNLLPNRMKESIRKDPPFGIHVHCPEAAQPKDGPSAGAAITIAILSLLSNIPVNNTIAITGEVDLNGNILAIGGLESKIEGAKSAGVTMILCPEDNADDLQKIRESKHGPLAALIQTDGVSGEDETNPEPSIKIHTISTIYEAIDYMLVGGEKSSKLFTHYTDCTQSHNDYLMAFKSMCDESQDLICIVDTSSEFKLLYCSKGFSDRLKWMLTDIYNTSVFEYIDEIDTDNFRKALCNTRKGETELCIRIRVLVNTGEESDHMDSGLMVICSPKKIDNIISCTMRVHDT